MIILESGPEEDPVAHARLRRVTSQWWTLEMGITGKCTPLLTGLRERGLVSSEKGHGGGWSWRGPSSTEALPTCARLTNG